LGYASDEGSYCEGCKEQRIETTRAEGPFHKRGAPWMISS
jgi:hypothetical protein